MTRIGLIRNPLSWRNRYGKGKKDSPVRPTDLVFAEPRTHGELRDALAEFARRGVEVVIVDGGDGTVRDVLTMLPDAYRSDLPALSIVASGKTNLIATDVGGAESALHAYSRLRDGRRDFSPHALRRRPILEIAWESGSHPTVRGMFLGAAAFTRATELAQREIHSVGLVRTPAVLLSIASSLLHATVGRRRGEWYRGVPMSLEIDGSPVAETRHFLFLATTLHRLVMGVWPFWNEKPNPIRWLDVKAEPTRIAAAAIPLLRGRPRPWMTSDGYDSGAADLLTLALSHPFVLDGETFEPGPGAVVHLSAERSVTFVAP